MKRLIASFLCACLCFGTAYGGMKLEITVDDGDSLVLEEFDIKLIEHYVSKGKNMDFKGFECKVTSIASAKRIFNFTTKHGGKKTKVALNGVIIGEPFIHAAVGHGTIVFPVRDDRAPGIRKMLTTEVDKKQKK